MKNRRLLLLGVCAAVLAVYAVWSGAAGTLAALVGGGNATAIADAPLPQVAENKTPAEPAPLNPLAGITVDAFGEIVERPLFNPTRAPQPVEESAPAQVAEPVAAPPQDTAKARDFTLLAIAIAGDTRIAMVRWNKTNEVFHLKQGQYLSDWELQSVGEKEVTIGRDEESFALKLFEGARPAGIRPPVQGDGEEAPTDPGAQVEEQQDVSEPDPALNSN